MWFIDTDLHGTIPKVVNQFVDLDYIRIMKDSIILYVIIWYSELRLFWILINIENIVFYRDGNAMCNNFIQRITIVLDFD